LDAGFAAHGDLRKVGNGDDLVASAKGCHFAANDAGNFPADVAINL
jgi:hypothetical protein